MLETLLSDCSAADLAAVLMFTDTVCSGSKRVTENVKGGPLCFEMSEIQFSSAISTWKDVCKSIIDRLVNRRMHKRLFVVAEAPLSINHL